jgi:Bacterial regulatory proteins, luxR family
VRGLLNKQISDVLGTSERTVKAHRGQVMHKMGVQSPAELGRAVEWLGEIFRADLRPTRGATGKHAAEKQVKTGRFASRGAKNLPKSTIPNDRQVCEIG